LGRNAYKILVGKPEGKRPLGRAIPRYVNNNKIDLREIERCCMDWTDLAQDRDQWMALLNTMITLRVPYITENFLRSYTIGGFSRGFGSMKLVYFRKLSFHKCLKILSRRSPGDSKENQAKSFAGTKSILEPRTSE
jgi:hypothetical protein